MFPSQPWLFHTGVIYKSLITSAIETIPHILSGYSVQVDYIKAIGCLCFLIAHSYSFPHHSNAATSNRLHYVLWWERIRRLSLRPLIAMGLLGSIPALYTGASLRRQKECDRTSWRNSTQPKSLVQGYAPFYLYPKPLCSTHSDDLLTLIGFLPCRLPFMVSVTTIWKHTSAWASIMTFTML